MIKVKKDLTGMKFGRLTVLSQAEDIKGKNRNYAAWLVQCDCGSDPFVTRGFSLSSGITKSCGCLQKEATSKANSAKLIGRRFGRLVVLQRLEDVIEDKKDGNVYWLCQCDCGNTCISSTNALISGNKKSCGCIHKEMLQERMTKHKMTDSRLYLVWKGMKARCYIPSHNHYDKYGARGIIVCDEWRNDFQAFYDWAMKNGYNENAKRGECTLERIDVNGNYCPENCCWANSTIQCINQNFRKDNKTGVKGVNFDKRSGKWQAQLQINKKKVLNKCFDNFEDAVKARKEAEEKYFGEFSFDNSQKKAV